MKRALREAKHWSLWRDLLGATFSAVGVVAVLVGLLDLFFPGRFAYNLRFGSAMVLTCLAYGVYRSWPRHIRQKFEYRYYIEVLVGDILTLNDSIMIGMCDTFDVETPTIISSSSLQGQFLDSIYGGDANRLQDELYRALAGVQAVGSISKPGNTTRYPIATVATLNVEGRHFHCVAYTSMDEHNVARATLEGVTRALFATWDAANQSGNGAPIAVPLIGQGLSRLNVLTPEAALRLVALTYNLRANKERIGAGLRIVLHPSQSKDVNLREFADFLRSLPGAR